MNKLIWQLFEMIRELLPATHENQQRLAKWSSDFHAAADPEQHPGDKPSDKAIGLEHEADLDPEQEAELEELENEGGHSHIEIERSSRGAPPKRKKRK